MSLEAYKAEWEHSTVNSEQYWADKAKQFYWEKPFTKVLDYNFHKSKGKVYCKWFEDGMTNICYNTLDRHLATKANDTCYILAGNDNETEKMTWAQVHAAVSRFANVLKAKGVQKGDRVAVYMPMGLQLPICMLACARIGAVHSVVFGGFSPANLALRIIECGAKVLVTADGVMRGKKLVTLKAISDEAMDLAKAGGQPVGCCIVFERKPHGLNGKGVPMVAGRDCSWATECAAVSSNCPVVWMNAEDPLFILYTSGSTGKPKGVVHTTGGYMVYAKETFTRVFDYRDGDVYWCTADCGWITGHTYIAYGPMLAGATQVLFEGTPVHPTNKRLWEIVEQHKVTQFYTAPTALRMLMAFGDDPVLSCDLSSLRVLGTVGEPINPAAWNWYNEVVGKKRCPIVDTWWQTETGGIALTPQASNPWPLKPGCATMPFFGMKPALLNPETKTEVLGNGVSGHLCMAKPWPGMMRTLWNNHERFEKTYFSLFDGYYVAGDGATRDEDGYYWVTGRVDDVLIVAGHNIGTAEIESALLNADNSVAEAAVVDFPHKVKGNAIYAYVTLKSGVVGTEVLKKKLINGVADKVGRFAKPDKIQWAPALPKTRSGKIMRRVLRKIADPKTLKPLKAGDLKALGDTSTMERPEVVIDLIAGAQNSAL